MLQRYGFWKCFVGKKHDFFLWMFGQKSSASFLFPEGEISNKTEDLQACCMMCVAFVKHWSSVRITKVFTDYNWNYRGYMMIYRIISNLKLFHVQGSEVQHQCSAANCTQTAQLKTAPTKITEIILVCFLLGLLFGQTKDICSSGLYDLTNRFPIRFANLGIFRNKLQAISAISNLVIKLVVSPRPGLSKYSWGVGHPLGCKRTQFECFGAGSKALRKLAADCWDKYTLQVFRWFSKQC